MNQLTAQKAIEFMHRVPLNGSEVRAWIEVAAALQAIANPSSDSPIIPSGKMVTPEIEGEV